MPDKLQEIGELSSFSTWRAPKHRHVCVPVSPRAPTHLITPLSLVVVGGSELWKRRVRLGRGRRRLPAVLQEANWKTQTKRRPHGPAR